MLAKATDTSTPPTSGQLARQMDSWYEIGNAVLVHQLGTIAAYDRFGYWREDGANSMQDWVAFRHGCSWTEAGKLVRAAHALEERPFIADAFSQGLLSFYKVELLTEFVSPEDDKEWAEKAQWMNAAQVKLHAGKARRLTRKDAAIANESRSLDLGWDHVKTVLRLRGVLVGPEAAAVYETLEHLAKNSGPNKHGVWESLSQRRADALAEICKLKLGDMQPSDRALVVVSITEAELNRVNGKGVLEDGPYIPSEVVRRLACDSKLQLVVRDENGEAIGIGTAQRSVPPKIYRLLKERDRCCVACGGTRRRRRAPRHPLRPRGPDRPRQPRAALLEMSPPRARSQLLSRARLIRSCAARSPRRTTGAQAPDSAEPRRPPPDARTASVPAPCAFRARVARHLTGHEYAA